MERVLIKPTSKEIVFRGKPEDGHVDAFSYNYEGNNSGSLGSLFIIGQVQPETEDTSYMVNLVASLAKREYYAQADAVPKESFSKTLKKINEVLQDFFRNKDIKVNIGIFAIAGESILISRLGKFKILLSRDGQNIDILNNINLFNKEHIQEKEFSNIISGKIMPKDKIFAYYPGRSILAREKNLKVSLTKYNADDFTEKLNSIKKDNDNFLCAGIHISIDKFTESAIITPPQPEELKKVEAVTVAAKTTKTPKIKPIPSAPVVSEVEVTTKAKTPAPEPMPEIKSPDSNQPDIKQDLKEEGNVYYPGNKSLVEDNQKMSSPEPEPSPLIRPSEFSSAKKANFLETILKKYKPNGIYIIGQQPLISKKKLILTGSLIVVIIAASIVAKLTFMPSLPVPGIQSQENKATQALLEQIKTDIQDAQNYKDQNNLLEARITIFKALSTISASNLDNKDLQTSKQDLNSLLNQIDNASERSPSLLYQISQDTGKGSLISFAKDKLLVYASSLTDANSGVVLETSETGIEQTQTVSNFNPLYLIGSDGLAVFINNVSDQIGSLTIKSGALKTSPLSLSGSVLSVAPYQDNLYILTSDGIYKITDAILGKNTAVSWLKEDTHVPVDAALMAIDSKIFVLTKSGILDTYYKGGKESEVNTSIPVDSDSALLTTTDSTSLYLVNMKWGRIYILNKASGALIKTLTLDSNQALVSASISDNETIYLLTKDNKVWKVNP